MKNLRDCDYCFLTSQNRLKLLNEVLFIFLNALVFGGELLLGKCKDVMICTQAGVRVIIYWTAYVLEYLADVPLVPPRSTEVPWSHDLAIGTMTSYLYESSI